MKNNFILGVLVGAMVVGGIVFLSNNIGNRNAEQGALVTPLFAKKTATVVGAKKIAGKDIIIRDTGSESCIIYVDTGSDSYAIAFAGSYKVFGSCTPNAVIFDVTGAGYNTAGDLPSFTHAQLFKGVTLMANGALSIAGDAISAMQMQLVVLGYLQQVPTGTEDANTALALKKYQTDNGLEVTGKSTIAAKASLVAQVAKIPTTIPITAPTK